MPGFTKLQVWIFEHDYPPYECNWKAVAIQLSKEWEILKFAYTVYIIKYEIVSQA